LKNTALARPFLASPLLRPAVTRRRRALFVVLVFAAARLEFGVFSVTLPAE
jgi:hypothetical protein